MCLLAIQYRTFAQAPILIAANREEFFDRPSIPPAIQPGSPRVLCGIDVRAGGTWLGVNEHGLVTAVTNRLKSNLPSQPRSRGLLCRELLNCGNASEAIDFAVRELVTNRYAGANFLCADQERAAVIQAADQLKVLDLRPGLHLITNGDLDDRTEERQLLARYLFAARFPSSAERFLTLAAEILAQGPDAQGGPTIVLRGEDRGTVSSTLLALTRPREKSVFRYAAGPPDRTAHADLSPLMHELFAPAETAVGA
jgi:uncharacterized protein with NRDE domain